MRSTTESVPFFMHSYITLLEKLNTKGKPEYTAYFIKNHPFITFNFIWFIHLSSKLAWGFCYHIVNSDVTKSTLSSFLFGTLQNTLHLSSCKVQILIASLSSTTLSFYHRLTFITLGSHYVFHLAPLLVTLLIHTLHTQICLESLLISIPHTSQALRIKLQLARHQCWWAGSTPELHHG